MTSQERKRMKTLEQNLRSAHKMINRVCTIVRVNRHVRGSAIAPETVALALQKLGGARIGELVEVLHRPKPVVARALEKGRRDGLVELRGEKRRAQWAAIA